MVGHNQMASMFHGLQPIALTFVCVFRKPRQVSPSKERPFEILDTQGIELAPGAID